MLKYTPTSSRLTLLLLSLLMLPGLAPAEQAERWYQVEIIVFAQKSKSYHDSELWPLDYSLPNLKDSRELQPGGRGAGSAQLPPPFSLVSKDKLQLNDAAYRFKRAGDVELLLHLGWVQPGLADNQAVAVHIYEGMNGGSASKSRRLDGTLRLILSRYLHLESDLIWREPLPPGAFNYDVEMSPTLSGNNELAQNSIGENEALPMQSGDGNTVQPHYRIFRLQQSRRMRSGEIHYLDHPLFGIVALVTPYEP